MTNSINNKKNKQDPNTHTTTKSLGMLSYILNGEFLTKDFVLKNLNFIFFIIFLLLLSVAEGYYGKQLFEQVDSKQRELEEITAEYVETKARLEEITRRQVLSDKLELRGLKETVNPTKVIRIHTTNKEEK